MDVKKDNYANQARLRRHQRVRKRVSGTPARPRLSVFRSANQIYAQVIDDSRGHTLLAAPRAIQSLRRSSPPARNYLKATNAPEAIRGLAANPRIQQAWAVGQLVAQRARAQGIQQIVFDRGGYIYHGRVAALAEGARKGGLDF